MSMTAQLQALIQVDNAASRVRSLRNYGEAERASIMREWVDHCSLEDVVALHEHDRTLYFEMERWLCGSKKLNVNATNRDFFIAPTGEKKPSIEINMRDGDRQFMRLTNPTRVRAEIGLRFLLKFGANGMYQSRRDLVKEIDEEEYLEHRRAMREREQEKEILDSDEAAKKSQARAKRTK